MNLVAASYDSHTNKASNAWLLFTGFGSIHFIIKSESVQLIIGSVIFISRLCDMILLQFIRMTKLNYKNQSLNSTWTNEIARKTINQKCGWILSLSSVSLVTFFSLVGYLCYTPENSCNVSVVSIIRSFRFFFCFKLFFVTKLPRKLQLVSCSMFVLIDIFDRKKEYFCIN